MSTPQPSDVLSVDGRGRVSVARLARHRFYTGTTDAKGVITLVPVKVVPDIDSNSDTAPAREASE